jgi:hypothetical protein
MIFLSRSRQDGFCYAGTALLPHKNYKEEKGYVNF